MFVKIRIGTIRLKGIREFYGRPKHNKKPLIKGVFCCADNGAILFQCVSE
jgi:hypothetical protein